LAHLRQRLALRETYARNLSRILIAQIAIADIVFIVYAWAGMDWKIPPAAISAWLGAVVVQVVGVVAVVTKGLFPEETADYKTAGAPAPDASANR